ncbi:hypothetical protein N325_01261, partial [Colius striatus]
LLLSLSCLVCFNSFFFFLKVSTDTQGLKFFSPPSSPPWSFLFSANFSECCLFLNCLTVALPGVNCPFANFLVRDLGFPSSSLLL